MSCARGYIARKWKGIKEISEILWIYGEGKTGLWKKWTHIQTEVQISSKVWFRAAATTRCAHDGYRLTVCPWVQDSHAPFPSRKFGNSRIDSPGGWVSLRGVGVIWWTLATGSLGPFLLCMNIKIPKLLLAMKWLCPDCSDVIFPELSSMLCACSQLRHCPALQRCLCFHTVWTNGHIFLRHTILSPLL